jgi:hypothetical protein
MATLEGGVSAASVGVGLEAASAAHSTIKPIPYGVLGHYRVNHRCALAGNQAANSRLFEMRNTHATNLIVPTRLVVRWIQTGGTASTEDSLDVFKVTAFSAVDTTNTVTPTTSVKRASMAAPPGAAAIRGVTVAGAAAGMTGGTLTKDGGSIGQLVQQLLGTLPTAGTVGVLAFVNFGDMDGTHPFAFAQNEGFIIENRVLLGIGGGGTVYIDFSWAEVTVY